jgi:hypothetical protein
MALTTEQVEEILAKVTATRPQRRQLARLGVR